jgi:two-component system LytT family response regulator
MPDLAPIRVLLVDDEPGARELLREFLEPHDAVVVAEAANGIEAVDLISQHAPDLVFLDVQMPGLTGFDVVERLPEPLPHVVFATAFDVFALRAFEAGAIDYLLKPFEQTRFDRAFARAAAQIALRRRGDATDASPQLKTAVDAAKGAPLTRLFVRMGERILPVVVADVIHAEASGDATTLYTADRTYVCGMGLGDLETRLPDGFARVHRSHVIALDAIEQITSDGSGGYVATLRGNRTVRISRTYAPAIRDRIY